MVALPTVLAIETASLTAWPGLHTAYDGHWIWRASRGYTKRANSIHCLDPNDDEDAELRIKRLSELFARHNLPPVFRVTPLTGSGIEAALDQLGWREHDRSIVLGMTVREVELAVNADVWDGDPSESQWSEVQARLCSYDATTLATLRAMTAAIPCTARGFIVQSPSGEPTATLLATIANDRGLFFNVVTAPEHRRRGYGRALMAAALNWCRHNGALSCALQVLVDNAAGRALYERLGFAELYRYHYSRPQ